MDHLAFGRSAARSAGARAAVLVLGMCCAAGLARGQGAGEGIRYNGFGTVALTRTDPLQDGDNASRPAPPGQVETSDGVARLGLQANFRPTTRWELVGQILATTDAGDGGKRLGIEWAFAGWHADPSTRVRAGRMNFDLFLASEYRDVGFANLTARRPADFYALLPSAMEGVDIARDWNRDDWHWRAKAYAGRTVKAAAGLIGAEPVVGVIISGQTDGLMVRTSLGRWRISTTPEFFESVARQLRAVAALTAPAVAAQAEALAARVDLSNQTLTYTTLGARYDGAAWSATAEFTRTLGPGPVSFAAAALTVGRRFDAVTLFGAAGTVRPTQAAAAAVSWEDTLTPVLGADGARQVQGLAAFAATAGPPRVNVLSVGARWDAAVDLALKLQYDREHARFRAPAGSAAPGSTRSGTLTFTIDGVF